MNEKKKHSQTGDFEAFVFEFLLDMRTPLNMVVGHSKSILDGPCEAFTDSQRQEMETVHEAALHLMALHNNLVDIAKMATGKMTLNLEMVDLDTAIQERVSSAIQRDPSQTIEYRSESVSPPITVRADPLRLRQILFNLLAFFWNAEGVVDIQIVQDRASATARVDITCPENIADTYGEELVDYLSADDPKPLMRTGFSGLIIAKYLILLHGGRLWAEVDPQTGSRIHFTLPAEVASGAGEDDENGA